MRVAMLAPISWRVPPRHYGPWERVVSLLTEGLVERGVDVTLFATGDSVTQARLDAVCPRPLEEDPSLDPKVYEALPGALGNAPCSRRRPTWIPSTPTTAPSRRSTRPRCDRGMT